MHLFTQIPVQMFWSSIQHCVVLLHELLSNNLCTWSRLHCSLFSDTVLATDTQTQTDCSVYTSAIDTQLSTSWMLQENLNEWINFIASLKADHYRQNYVGLVYSYSATVAAVTIMIFIYFCYTLHLWCVQMTYQMRSTEELALRLCVGLVSVTALLTDIYFLPLEYFWMTSEVRCGRKYTYADHVVCLAEDYTTSLWSMP